MRTTRITTVPLATLLSAVALAGPAAARPADAGPPPPKAPASAPLIIQHTTAADPQSSGFDWGSAGIGAAGAVGALAIALAGTSGVRRRRVSRPGSAVTH